MTENKVEQHNNKTVPDDYKIYIDKGHTMLANIKSKWIKDLPSSFA